MEKVMSAPKHKKLFALMEDGETCEPSPNCKLHKGKYYEAHFVFSKGTNPINDIDEANQITGRQYLDFTNEYLEDL